MTIKELADELGVSKVSVNKKLDALGLKDNLIKQGNRFLVSDEIADKVREAFGDTRREPKPKQEDDTVIEILNEQLREKDKQIAELMNQLRTLQEQNGTLLQTVQQGNFLLAGGTLNGSDRWENDTVNTEPEAVAEEVPKKKGFLSRFFR